MGTYNLNTRVSRHKTKLKKPSKNRKMFTISNRNNFYNNDMSLLDDMFFDQAFLNHSMQPRYAVEPFRFCDARPAPRGTALQMNCLPSFQSKRRHPMGLTFDMLPLKRSRQNYFDDLMASLMMPVNCTKNTKQSLL